MVNRAVGLCGLTLDLGELVVGNYAAVSCTGQLIMCNCVEVRVVRTDIIRVERQAGRRLSWKGRVEAGRDASARIDCLTSVLREVKRLY